MLFNFQQLFVTQRKNCPTLKTFAMPKFQLHPNGTLLIQLSNQNIVCIGLTLILNLHCVKLVRGLVFQSLVNQQFEL